MTPLFTLRIFACVLNISVGVSIAICGLIMLQGRIPEKIRARWSWVYNTLPSFKLELTHRVTLLFFVCGVFAFFQQFSTLLLLTYGSRSDYACDSLSRTCVFFLLSAYVFMIVMMLVRSAAARPPESKLPLYERLLDHSFWIFVIIAISMPFVYSGKRIPDSIQPDQFICATIIEHYEANILMLIFDLIVSVSLLYLFHSRVKSLADPSLGVSNRERYLSIAKVNLRSSLLILSSTVIMNLTITLSHVLFDVFQAYAIGFHFLISLAIFSATIAVMKIMGPAFEWPSWSSVPNSPSPSVGN
eukprot:TRINITY_DN30553_c0_g1_i1.p1 TRINITY_DN30553_c0_g1~~TRINITY_DN30553_c0_g1_i1.p1  ORF type:complete len:301 (+),score=51.20 TRINITY_DN30553_c0_g1_i1:22-924(+)